MWIERESTEKATNTSTENYKPWTIKKSKEPSLSTHLHTHTHMFSNTLSLRIKKSDSIHIYSWCIPVACAFSRSFDDEPGFDALTPNALTRTENRAPVFCRRWLIPSYSHDIAHGIAPSSFAEPSEPNIVFDWPVKGTTMREKKIIRKQLEHSMEWMVSNVDDDDYYTYCLCIRVCGFVTQSVCELN